MTYNVILVRVVLLQRTNETLSDSGVQIPPVIRHVGVISDCDCALGEVSKCGKEEAHSSRRWVAALWGSRALASL